MKQHILVIDDDKTYRDMLRTKLVASGYDVTEAINGEDALDLVNTKPGEFDLIILDLVMPEMDGLTFYYWLKKSASNNIPVIILSNQSISSYPTDIQSYIVKTDITLDALMEKIKSTIA